MGESGRVGGRRKVRSQIASRGALGAQSADPWAASLANLVTRSVGWSWVAGLEIPDVDSDEEQERRLRLGDVKCLEDVTGLHVLLLLYANLEGG